MDREQCRLIQKELEAAAITIAAKHGFTIGNQSASYNSDGAKLKIEFKGKDSEKNDWERYAEMIGMRKDDLGKTFVQNGHTFKICGIMPSRPKFPVIAERQPDGKKFKFTVDGLRPKLDGKPFPFQTFPLK